MKKILIVLSILTFTLLVACAPQNTDSSKKAEEQKTTVDTNQNEKNDENTENSEKGMTMELSTIEGTISEIKDMSFVIKTDSNEQYLLPFEKKPEGLDSVKDGDKVKVTYGGGKLSEVDSFEGVVTSVEKLK